MRSTNRSAILQYGATRPMGAMWFSGLLGAAIAIVIVMQLKNGWWLDAGDRIAEMLIVLGVAAVFVGLWKNPKVPAHLRVALLWVGFMITSSLILVIIGPGTIFPIVLIGIAGLSLGAVLAGGLVGIVRERFGH